MIHLSVLLADVSLPDPLGQKIDSPPTTAAHLSPAFVALAIGALALVVYLLWDFYKQKREERRQRLRIERFREKKFSQVQEPPT